MKKKRPRPSITVRLIQNSDGTWKIAKTADWKKREEILRQAIAQQEKPAPVPESKLQSPSGKNIPSAEVLPAKIVYSDILTSESLEMPSYSAALQLKQETIWKELAKINVRDALDLWLESIQNQRTQKAYRIAMDELILKGFLDPGWSLQQFSLLSPEQLIDSIKTSPIQIRDRNGTPRDRHWSIRTKEARIACFLSFTRYLSRKTDGMIRRGIPSKDGVEKTFSFKSRKVKSDALSRSQLMAFFEELDKINTRDAMIARLCLHGGKRINEVLSLKVEQIDFEKKQIIFYQSKSKFSDDFTVISFEKPAAGAFLQELKTYIGDRNGLVFITANGKGLKQNQVDRNFLKAGRRAALPFRVSPHNLRASAVTLWKEDGFSDSLIMKATGHSSSEMVHKYDKTELVDNVTRKSCLI